MRDEWRENPGDRVLGVLFPFGLELTLENIYNFLFCLSILSELSVTEMKTGPSAGVLRSSYLSVPFQLTTLYWQVLFKCYFLNILFTKTMTLFPPRLSLYFFGLI